MSRNVLWTLFVSSTPGWYSRVLFRPWQPRRTHGSPADCAGLVAVDLTDRIARQTMIAQVYWDTTFWPEVNPQPKPALNEVLPAAAIALVDSLAPIGGVGDDVAAAHQRGHVSGRDGTDGDAHPNP
ncbi:MAG: hypothetical protein IPL78_34740 [Chloroflexi bacterium]|nr:hypothetical protein [Chloroflexota bacterium]